jgi:hypothetical protein
VTDERKARQGILFAEKVRQVAIPLQKILIIDAEADGRFFLGRTVARKFPHAVGLECQTRGQAEALAKDPALFAIICHKAIDAEGKDLIPLLRSLRPDVAIVYISGTDRSQYASALGADAFLLFEEWLRIGVVLEEAVSVRQKLNARNTGGT